MFKGGEASPVDPPDYKQVRAIRDRQKDFEIEFPNLEGYRVEYGEDELLFDFSEVENYEIDGSKFPLATTMQTAFSVEEETLEVSQVLERREQEIIYLITKELIQYHFSDDDGNAQFQKFSQLKNIVQHWYNTKVVLLNISEPEYKKLLYFEDPKTVADHINRGINPHINTSEFIKPVFNYYNKFGSTKQVAEIHRKKCMRRKSHVNFVVKDSGWEEICARTLEELDVVRSYVKNDGWVLPYPM